MPKLARVLVVALVALALPAAAYGAGAVSTDATGDLTYTGDVGVNVVEISTSPTGPGNVIFEETGISEGTDSASICTDLGSSVICNYDTADSLNANGGNGADQITAGGPLPVAFNGGADDDRLTGGTGPDSLYGGGGADDMFGNEGNDFTQLDPDDGDEIDFGPGRDAALIANGYGTGEVYRGGTGHDSLVYLPLVSPGPGFRIDLQKGTINVPAVTPFEAVSSVMSGFEDVGAYTSSVSDDVLIGNAGSNLLAGGPGVDQITGGPGSDTMLGDHGLVPFGGLGVGVQPNDPSTAGGDTISARDGFADAMDCGPAADTALVDQFDVEVENCESAPRVNVFAFGIAPPAAPAAPDTTAPRCKRSKLARRKRKAFLSKGFSFRVNCNEEARVEVFAAVTAKRRKGKVVFSKAGDVLLAQKTFGFKAGSRTLRFKAAKSVRRALAKRFKVRLRIDATDRVGNRRTSTASFSVR